MMTLRSGPHEVDIEAPDLVTLRWRGVLGPNDLVRAFEQLREHCSSWPHLLVVNDISKLESIPPDTRRVVPEATGWMPMRGVVMFGGSFAVRTLAMLLLKVVNLLRGGENPSHFVTTEEEARAWIEQRRRQLAGGAR